MISTLFTFNIAFPKTFFSTFSKVKTVTPALDTIVSFDCFIEDVKIGLMQESEYLSRVFLICLLPLFASLISFIIFGIIKKVKKKSNFKTKMVISIITIVYFFYPGLTEKIIGILKCSTIEGTERFYMDLELICWEKTHLNFVIFFGIPMMIAWVVGI